MAVGEQATIDWQPGGAQGESHGAAGEGGVSAIEAMIDVDEPTFEGLAIAMPAIWSAPVRSHANPLVTETEVTSDTAASRPVRRMEARI
jgi:hypothetical protein